MKRILIYGTAWCALSVAFAFGWAASRGLKAPAAPAPDDAGWSDYRRVKGFR